MPPNLKLASSIPAEGNALQNARARLESLLPGFAERAVAHDHDSSFPHENFHELGQAGLLALTVPVQAGGLGGDLNDASGIIGSIGRACPATALVLSMHYMNHLLISRANEWPLHLVQRLQLDAVNGGGLINALRVEPEQGSPARGGLPETVARRTDTGWELSGRKIYSTGSPALSWFAVWAKTDEPDVRVGVFLVPSSANGIRIEETWNHLGLRASGSHDVVLERVSIPRDHAVDVRLPSQWMGPDPAQPVIQASLLGALYDGVARAAFDWVAHFVKTRVPSGLGKPLVTLPRVQEVSGDIASRLSVNARLLRSISEDFDHGIDVSVSDANIVKMTVTGNAIAAVEAAMSLSGNHGLSRNNPLERHYRDVLCGRIHTPQDDSTRTGAGRLALGI